MAIIVEHDKRKHEILQKSLDVFIDEGYEDATFQKIADRCGITRTTLYIYFKNKHEIFLGSIKELLSELEKKLKEIIFNEGFNSEQKLRKTLKEIVDQFENNLKLFSVLLNYLLQLKKSGVDTNQRVRRRIIRVRHLLSSIIIEGIQKDQFKECNVKDMNELLYSLMESAIFRMSVLNVTDMTDIRGAMNAVVDNLLK